MLIRKTIKEETKSGSKESNIILQCRDVNMHYGNFHAVKNLNLEIASQQVTAFIGPSGCGKSTFLRAINRMNDFIANFRLSGKMLLNGEDIYHPRIDPVEVRLRVGMVFQNPNPFPKSIYENIALGPRLNRYRGNVKELVESSLKRAYLWEEVRDKLQESAYSLSGGQQQRLCIARAIAMLPEVLLMDEPTASLDPISVRKIEELINELKQRYTIIIVTHNMQQAARVGDQTIFLYQGELIESGLTMDIFTKPKKKLTEDYITGRFG